MRNPTVEGARALLAKAESVVGGDTAADSTVPSPGSGSPFEDKPGAEGVLDLYERLTKRLATVDNEKIDDLLHSIGKQLRDLDRLAADMDRLKRVRRNLKSS